VRIVIIICAARRTSPNQSSSKIALCCKVFCRWKTTLGSHRFNGEIPAWQPHWREPSDQAPDGTCHELSSLSSPTWQPGWRGRTRLFFGSECAARATRFSSSVAPVIVVSVMAVRNVASQPFANHADVPTVAIKTAPEGRLDHRDRQRAYRKRCARRRVTDTSSPTLPLPRSTVPRPHESEKTVIRLGHSANPSLVGCTSAGQEGARIIRIVSRFRFAV
jgi:hypothetical protein